MGIEQERFVDVNPELVCCICANVLEDPIESPCRHVFCSECITRWLDMRTTCPTCRQPLRNSQMKPALPLLRNIIAKLRIRCNFIGEGCNEIVDFEQLGSHVRSCPYAPMTCENEGCHESFPRKDSCRHKKECPFRRVVCTAFSNRGCGMEYKLSEAADHNCVESLKSLIRGLESRVATLEETLTELRQDMQELKQQQARTNHVTQETRNTRNSSGGIAGQQQDGDSGLISLLSDDEEENENQLWTPRTNLIQGIIADREGSTSSTLVNLVARDLQELQQQTLNQLELDRTSRLSRALRQSASEARRHSRSRSPVVRRNREISLDADGTPPRRQSLQAPSSACTQTSSSGNITQEQGTLQVVHSRVRAMIRPTSIEDDISSQVDSEENIAGSSDESDQHHTAESSSSDFNAESPQWSPDHSSSCSSSDDFGEMDGWWRNLVNSYSSRSATLSSDVSYLRANFH